MTITDEAQTWLKQAGFRNYCFISYPYTHEPELDECAQELKKAVRRELTYVVDNPTVYLAKTDIGPGVEWPDDLRINLCGSVAMVAILIRNYLSPRHDWCGIEWAAMEQLGKARLPNTPIRSIIPVKYRETDLPNSAAALQAIDISRQALLGKRYYRTMPFREATLKIVTQILEIASLIHKNACQAEVQNFQLPKQSAFAMHKTPRQPPPGRNE